MRGPGRIRAFRTLSTLLAASAFSAAVLVGPPVAAEVPESADPIKIVLNNWTSQLVLARVSGELLKKLGYNVEYRKAETQLQYTAMGNGDMHFQVEVWEGTMKDPFEKQVAKERMVDAGAHDAVTREEWWYPLYVEEVCPGLPDWEALNDCAGNLATPETAPKGRYLAGPTDWEKPDQERVEALGLNIQVVNAKAATDLWAALDAAVQRKEPIILFNWTPNWVEAKYDGNFIDFPDHHPACETDPSWGINPDAAFDCGNPKRGWLKKGVWSGLEKKWPCAFELIKDINFTNAQIGEAAAMVDVGGRTPQEAATLWIEGNKEVWQPWIPACAS
jgi:glycine betaine/proline transport system substrate-binding protein